jgi:hypothetical protein
VGVGLCGKTMNSEDVVPPLAANMNAAFKRVRGAIGGAADPDLADLIVARIVELAKDGVYAECPHLKAMMKPRNCADHTCRSAAR